MIPILLNTLAAFFALAQAPQGAGDFFPMRDGEILVGEISSHDEDALDIKRLDNGGLVHLRWSQLAPPFERSLRTRLGYIYDREEEVLVDADELTLADGTKRVGRVVSQTNDQIVLKDSKSTLSYARSILSGAPGRVRVPALEVYTKDELYNDKLSTIDATTAEGNLDLARYLEQVDDFGRAIQHANEVKKIDPNFHAHELVELLKHLEEKKARQDEIDYLQELESQRSQRHFDKAIMMCTEFAAKFPKSSATTRTDVEKRKKNIAEAKHIYQIDKVWIAYHRAARTVLRVKAVDRKIALDDARSYARGGEVRKDILASVLKTLQNDFKEITEQDVASLWKDRGKRAKLDHVGYGRGTFVLGKDGAKKNVSNMIGAKTGAAGKSNPELDAMAKKLQAMLQKAQAPQNINQKQLDPADEWWQVVATAFEREQFLLSTFVEFGGEMQDMIFTARPCVGCGGQGQLPVTSGSSAPGGVTVGSGGNRNNNNNQPQQSSVSYADCPTCHGIGFERLIDYR
ncbi:MAG: hypothetical protein HY286_03410 [Planctomycetes bacterium]|nr:hypothetical protein [Planctomycetota bacterium]